MTGTYMGVERETGIHHDTVRDWAKTDWWNELMEKAIADVSASLRSTGLKIVNEATKAVLDRLELGDEAFDKKGNIVRRKVPLRDALLASLTWFDKMRIINDQTLNFSKQTVNVKDLIKEMVKVGDAAKKGNLEALASLPIPTEDEVQENVSKTDRPN
jgi:hypothetical protein